MTNKMTNKEMYIELLVTVNVGDISEIDVQIDIDFSNLKIEQLDKKANTVSKADKANTVSKADKANTVSKADKAKAELNDTLVVIILEGMQALDKPVKVSDLIKGYESLSAYSIQKLTPIMTKLVTDGKIVKSVVKRKTFYSLV